MSTLRSAARVETIAVTDEITPKTMVNKKIMTAVHRVYNCRVLLVSLSAARSCLG